MDFQIYTQADFESQAERFLHELLERGYSNSTIGRPWALFLRLELSDGWKNSIIDAG